MIIRKVFKLDEKGNPYVCMSADIDFNQAVSDWKKIQSEKKKSSKQDDAFHNKTRKKNTKNTY